MIKTLLGLSVFSQTQVAVFGNPVPFYVEEIQVQYTTCQPGTQFCIARGGAFFRHLNWTSLMLAISAQNNF